MSIDVMHPVRAEVTGHLYIDGHWSDGAAGWLDVIDPSTGRVVGRAAQASAEDAGAAAAAARCRMGDPAAPTSVVGPDCRVLGFDELYVADASIFPTVTRANTNITAVMVGERTADLLLGRNQG